MKPSFKRGFTLVELLVVVLIIGILSSVALPQYTKAVNKARGVQFVTAGKALADAMNMAYLEDGSYRRHFLYGTYSFMTRDEGDFDIEVPIPNHSWLGNFVFGASGNGSQAEVSLSLYEFSQYRYGNDATLTYYLRDGKISSVRCEGKGCSMYFPSSLISGR